MSHKRTSELVRTCVLVLMLIALAQIVAADSYIVNCNKLGMHVLKKALSLLNRTNVTESVLLLTNVKYVIVRGFSLACIESSFAKAGFVELLNLVNVHSPYYSVPWIFLYDNATGRAVYLQLDPRRVVSFLKSGHAENIFSKISVFTLNISRLIIEGRSRASAL